MYPDAKRIRIPMSQHARAAATSQLALDLTVGC